MLRCNAVRGCTCGELVEVTSLPVFQAFFFGEKHVCWRGWWEVTYSLGVRMGLQREYKEGGGPDIRECRTKEGVVEAQ
jgi:hypothetical protein